MSRGRCLLILDDFVAPRFLVFATLEEVPAAEPDRLRFNEVLLPADLDCLLPRGSTGPEREDFPALLVILRGLFLAVLLGVLLSALVVACPALSTSLVAFAAPLVILRGTAILPEKLLRAFVFIFNCRFSLRTR